MIADEPVVQPRDGTRAMEPAETGYVIRDGVRIAWERYGDGSPTILLMPTWSIIHSRHWKGQIAYLARHFRVVTFDGRGNGRSDRPLDPEAYRGEQFMDDAIAVLDASGTDRAVLAGLSMGSGYALRLAETLASADVVALHVPLTQETKHLIGRRELALMKPTAYLINVARGPVVDEGALAHALGAGLIAGAGLDVYEQEPTVHAGLLDLPNVVLSPHLGSATHETRTAMAQLAADNVAAFVSGRPPLTPVAGSYLPDAGADR